MCTSSRIVPRWARTKKAQPQGGVAGEKMPRSTVCPKCRKGYVTVSSVEITINRMFGDLVKKRPSDMEWIPNKPFHPRANRHGPKIFRTRMTCHGPGISKSHDLCVSRTQSAQTATIQGLTACARLLHSIDSVSTVVCPSRRRPCDLLQSGRTCKTRFHKNPDRCSRRPARSFLHHARPAL